MHIISSIRNFQYSSSIHGTGTVVDVEPTMVVATTCQGGTRRGVHVLLKEPCKGLLGPERLVLTL